MGDAVDTMVFCITFAGDAIDTLSIIFFAPILGQDVTEIKTCISGVMQ